MPKLEETHVIRISKEMKKTLKEMKKHKVDVGRILRLKLQEIIDENYKQFKPIEQKDYFSLSLEKALKSINVNAKAIL